MAESEINVSLTIRDDPDLKDGQLGCAIAAELPAEVGLPIRVHIEAYGFDPDKEGARRLAAMLDDMSAALEKSIAELPDQPTQTVQPTRPRFNPQPRKRLDADGK